MVDPDSHDSPQGEKPSTDQRRSRLIPPIWCWLVAAICVALIVWLQRPGSLDHQIANIVSLVLAFLAGMSFAAWFVFFSGYASLVRLLAVVVCVTIVTLFFARYRIQGVSGELIPRWADRWAPRHDETLDTKTPEIDAAINLASPGQQAFSQFLGPNRDAVIDGVSLKTDWSEHPPEMIWRQPIGAGWSGFAASGGHALTLEQRGELEMVTCYNIGTGEMAWSNATEALHQTVLGGVGPRSTPTIDGNTVYTLGATGVLKAIDGADGSTIWVKELRKIFGVTDEQDEANIAWGRAASPLVVDGMVVVPAGGPTESPVSLVAFDKQTGEEVWRGGDAQISYASPSVAELDGVRQILIVNESTASGHDVQTGDVLWQADWPGSSNTNASASQAAAVGENRVLLSKGYGGGSALLEIERDGERWQATRVWHEPSALKTKFANIVAYKGHAYGLSDGILECVAIDSGRRQWKRGRYGHGQILRVGEVILVQAESGEVAMVRASADGYDEIDVFQAIEGNTWNNLCLYGPYLLVRNAEQAACYKLAIE